MPERTHFRTLRSGKVTPLLAANPTRQHYSLGVLTPDSLIELQPGGVVIDPSRLHLDASPQCTGSLSATVVGEGVVRVLIRETWE